jgi:adenylate kinase family enzyme
MKTYKILVLGASGSGKTFFLASMFKRLAIQNNEIGFFLDANPKQKQALVNLFHTIADPHKDWPPGTQRSEIHEWRFTYSIKSKQGNTYPIFTFTT